MLVFLVLIATFAHVVALYKAEMNAKVQYKMEKKAIKAAELEMIRPEGASNETQQETVLPSKIAQEQEINTNNASNQGGEELSKTDQQNTGSAHNIVFSCGGGCVHMCVCT